MKEIVSKWDEMFGEIGDDVYLIKRKKDKSGLMKPGWHRVKYITEFVPKFIPIRKTSSS